MIKSSVWSDLGGKEHAKSELVMNRAKDFKRSRLDFNITDILLLDHVFLFCLCFEIRDRARTKANSNQAPLLPSTIARARIK